MPRLANGEIINVGRNYLTVRFSYLVHPLVRALLLAVSIPLSFLLRKGFRGLATKVP